MINKNKIIISGFLAVIIFTVFIFVFQFLGPKINVPYETITVNLNTTEKELIPKLKAQGYIKSEWAFNLVLRIKGWQGKIAPGGYEISKSMNVFQLANILVNHPYEKWVIIPEGLRKEEIADKIQKELSWDEAQKLDFINSAQEGYMFPSTYLFRLDYSGADAAKRMESQFNEEVADLLKKALSKNIRNDTLVILASLVQREAANEKEMPLIAGVIWNRWLKEMPFQIDATIQYALGKEDIWWPVVKLSDYKIDSPYNTYTNKGKPPTPICNPGIAAMNAVVNSQDSEYLFYLHDSSGQIHLAKTYAEHQANITKYLK